MAQALTFLQLGLSILLIVTILLQQRGTGLGGAFGGSGTVYRSKRGVEQLLFRSTVAIALLFVLVAMANIAVQS
ncbi:preprotein translocase subunit SecG [Candidatus Berkelbacteria bacterium]|nr:preprotein translocase subunit SecG [Candidatus Berkelbacteria bacterium]